MTVGKFPVAEESYCLFLYVWYRIIRRKEPKEKMWDESERVSRGIMMIIMRKGRSKGHIDQKE